MEPEELAEAQATVAALKDEKQVLAIQRRELVSAKADENARWRERQAGRTPGIRSRGLFGTVVASKRQSERLDHANRINRLVAQQGEIDARIRDIDREIRELDAFIRSQRPAATPRSSTPKTPMTTAPGERLRVLAQLRADGLITDVEYEAKKGEILSQM